MRGIIVVARTSFASATTGSVLITVLSVLFAVVPSAQVLLMASLVTALTSNERNLSSIVGTLAMIVLLVGLIGPLRALRDFLAEIVQLNTGATLQGQLADRAATLTPAEIAEEDLASAIEGHSRAIVDQVSRTYVDVLLAAESIAGAIGIVITLGRYSWAASALTAASIVPTFLIGIYVARIQKSMWLRLGRVYRRERYLRETLSNRSALLELTAFGTMSRFAQLEKDAQARICEVRKEPIVAGLKATGALAGANALLFGLSMVAVFSQIGFQPVAVAAVYGLFAAVSAVSTGGTKISALVQYLPNIGAVIGFLDRPSAASSAPAGWAGDRIERLQLQSVEVAYGADQLAVKGATLTVSRGEMIAIVGRNGAGKTTLLNALLGLVPIRSGSVFANGQPVTPAAQDWWLGSFGSMAQDFGKYEVTIDDAVRLGSAANRDASDVHQALRAARADTFVERLREGTATQLGEMWGGAGLSGGQWQRLALARVYLRNADVWILDEPSSAIDAETEIELFDELQHSRSDRATIVVSHRAWTLRNMDRIYVMDEGKVVEEGRFDDLVSANGTFAELFREQTTSVE